jgi:hypothetical protein
MEMAEIIHAVPCSWGLMILFSILMPSLQHLSQH